MARPAVEPTRRTEQRVELTIDDMARARDGRLFHQGADEHYDQISALIKSVRGSDADAALYWMARMIEGGEDPRFLARRMVILASEDIGLADPQALLVAEAAARAVEYVGLPEAALNLAEAVIYLAGAPKSNAVLVALGRAQADVRSGVNQEVPTHLRDAHYKGAARLGHGEGYVYPHDDPSGAAGQQYRPEALEGRVYFEPSSEDRDPGADGYGWHERDRDRPRQGGRFVKRRNGSGALLAVGPVRRGARADGVRRPRARDVRRRRRGTAAEGHAAPGRAATFRPAPRTWVRRLRARCSTSTSCWRDRDPTGLTQAVAAVSTPGSPEYHHYLTSGAVRGGVRPRTVDGGAGVVGAAQRGPDGGHAGVGQRLAAGERDRGRRVRGLRHAARAGATGRSGRGPWSTRRRRRCPRR